MRFLYGDSAPFPLGYNFLATLEAFMEAATRIVHLEQDSRELTRATEELGQGRVKGLEALEQFHTVVMRAVQDTAQKVRHAHALEYAQRVAEFASHYVDEHRRAAVAANEREAAQCRAENDRRIAEQRSALETFLKVARMPVLATRISMRMSVEGKEVDHQITGVFDNPDGIQTSFKLGTSGVPAWAQARKVSDLAEGVELLVGIDKSWLRGTVTPKQVSVDEWLLSQFDVSEDAFDFSLRRKPQEKDALAFRVRRTESGLIGSVDHLGAPGTEGLDTAIGPNDLAQIDRLWQALRISCRELVDRKEQLLFVSLDGQPVFEGGLVVPFVVRLVAMFAPTVREIAKRSPNEFELSLKMEAEGGRREEIYLRKEQLVSKLQPLSSAGREVFAPLGLDTWVPGTTTVPPPVVASVPPPAPSSRRPVEG